MANLSNDDLSQIRTIVREEVHGEADNIRHNLKTIDSKVDGLSAGLTENNLRLTNLGLRVERVEGEVQAIGNDIKELHLMQKPRTS